MDSQKLVCDIYEWLKEKKAEDIVVIDIRPRNSFSEFMVIASGLSSRKIYSIAKEICKNLKALHRKPWIEGLEKCEWILIDVENVMIHLFKPEVRMFYALEEIWREPNLLSSSLDSRYSCD